MTSTRQPRPGALGIHATGTGARCDDAGLEDARAVSDPRGQQGPHTMIRRVQALNYRCLRYVDLSLDRFHVLVGPNASGKSTLFDVVAFLGDVIRDGVGAAMERRTENFQDLIWNRPQRDMGFELAVEVDVPDKIKERLPREKGYRVFRYEIAIRESDKDWRIASERGLLMSAPYAPRSVASSQASLFPNPPRPPNTILAGGHRRGRRTILSKSPDGTDRFNIETSDDPGKGWVTSIAFGPKRSALRNLPESPDNFPMASYVKSLLGGGIDFMFLDSKKMRLPSPPHLNRERLSADGHNLHRLIHVLKKADPNVYQEWLEHVQTVLEDLDDIRVVDQEYDRSVYLTLVYETGLEVPSWMVSDGTLRFLAMTLIPYLSRHGQVYLLEEPENGVHPLALDAVYSSLSSAYESQVLVATHSPSFLSLASPKEILCFAKSDEGATDIVRGNDHPMLREWQEGTHTELLFAKGVIG